VIGIGVVGYGYWGPNLVRNFSDVPECQVIAVSDLRPERRAHVQSRYPAVQATDNFEDLLTDSRIDAVVIATPVESHFDLALRALKAGKHVLVEKPLATSSDQVLRLMDEAARQRRILAVDHTFIYTGAVRKIKELVADGGIGELYYYDSVRVNLGLFQHDVNVLWDLAVHDLAIMDHVLPIRPCAVSATGVRHVAGEPEDIAYLTLHFDAPLIAHMHVNWLAPVKVRRTLIGGSRRMIVYDDVEPSEKVKVFDKGITVNGNGNGNGAAHDASNPAIYQMLVGYRTGDMLAPKLDMTEALLMEARHFVRCITQGEEPQADGRAGLRVVSVLEAATRSMRERGRVVELDTDRCLV
jgi:predicted dehydrogenase